MKNITELYDAYLAKEREERRINERIIDRELQIERLEKKKSKLGGWIANLITPLAQTLTPLLECDTFEILGPFGLRAETSIWFKKKDSTAKYCDYSLSVTVHNEWEKDCIYAKGNNVIINCGKNRCIDCRRCYKPNKTPIYVSEILK